MQITVFGAGAIGGFLAAALARSGNDVSVVARGEHLHALQRTGRVRVIASDLGAFEAPVSAFRDLREAPHAPFVLLTFKSHQWDGVLAQLLPAVAHGATIVTLQNGLPFWYSTDRALEAVDPGGALRSAIPDERIVGGVVHTSGHIVEAGAIHQSGGMLYPLGELDGSHSDRVIALAQTFEAAGLRAPIEPVIRRTIWRKVINNTAFNPVSALTRATMHRMLRDVRIRETLRRILEQGIAVAKASGVDPKTSAEERLKWAEHLADVKTSMLQDVEARKPLELDPIVGAVVELAARYDVAVPTISTVYALTKLLEASVCR